MGVLFANRVKTTLSAAATAGATSLALSNVANLPAIGSGNYCYLTLTSGDQSIIEVVKATAIVGNSVTVTRAQDNTAAAAWPGGTSVELRLTTQSLLDALAERLGVAATAAAAVKLATPRTFDITGDMTWQVTFDGSANVSAAGTIAAKAVTNGKLADMAAAGLKGATAAGAVTDLSVASVKTLLSITNVENKSSATIRSELTSGNVTTALGFTPEVAGTCLKVGGDGGLEIGNYLDFHTAADGVDFKVRLQADVNGKLSIAAAQGVYVNGVVLPDLTTVADNYVPKVSNIGNADLNNAVTSGFHRYDVPTNGPGTGFNYAPLIVARANDTIAQVAFSYNTGDMAWRAGNPTSAGGTGAWSAWDKISNYVKKSDPTFTGSIMWLNTDKALYQHDGSNGYLRTQVGSLNIGAAGNTKLSIATNGAITATGPITVSVGAANVGLDLCSNDAWLGTRVLRNSNASIPSMYIGYGGEGSVQFFAGSAAAANNTASRFTISTDGGIYLPQSGWYKFEHANQSDSNDGIIAAGKFGDGLNIIGVQTIAGQGRKISVWGTLRNMNVSGGLFAYHTNSAYSSAGITVSTAAPSGGTDGDIWLKV